MGTGRIARLLRTKRALTGEAGDTLARAIAVALDELEGWRVEGEGPSGADSLCPGSQASLSIRSRNISTTSGSK